MLRSIFHLSSLLLGVALLLLGSGLLSTLLAVRGGIEGFDSQTLGAIGAMYFVGFLAGTYLGPMMIRRVGHVRAFAFFTAAIACAALLHELFILSWLWGLLRLITGMSMVGLYTIIESWLNSHAAPEQRSRIFAVYMGVNLGSLAVAQQLLQSSDPAQHILFAFAAVSICAAVMPVAATRLTQPHMGEVQSIGLKVLYERAPVACAAALLSGFSQGAFWGLGPVWADISHLGTSGIAWFMTLTIIGGAVFQWPIGQLTNRLDRGHVISVVAFTLYPLAVARMMDRLDKREIISGCGSLLLLHGIGATIGPLIAGSLMHHFGPQALPSWFITVQLSLTATAWALSVRAPADLAHQRPLTPMVRTTPGVMEMLEIPAEAETPAR